MNGVAQEEAPQAFSSRARACALVLFVLTVHLLLSWRWSHANGWLARPTITEATPYRVASARLLVSLEEGGLTAWLAAGLSEPDDHTPLLSMVGALIGWISSDGISPTVMWATLMLFAWLLGLGTYRLARAFLAPGAAAAVMALTLSAPVTQAYQRDYLTTLPMVALLVWALAALVRSDSFGRPRASLRFGLWAGLAAFAKVIAPLYLVGPALVALVAGLRRRRVDTLRNLLLAAALFVLVMGPWMWFSLPHVLEYTGAVVEQKGLGATQSAFTLGRWLYYPREVLNRGFGFPLGLLVVGATIASLTRAWRRRAQADVDLRAWTLAALVPVSWVILSYGQATTGAQYVFLWVPLGCLLLVAVIVDSAGALRRRTLAALALVALLFNTALAQRSILDDNVLLRWKGLSLVGNTGQYLGYRYRRMKVRVEPEAEPWPVLEFTELVLADAAPDVPRLAGSHPIITGNMSYEATLLRRELDRVPHPWAAILQQAHRRKTEGRERFERDLPAKNPYWPLTTIDYFVTDSLLLDESIVRELIERLGMQVEVLATREVTADSTVRLLALRKPWRRPKRVPRTVLAEAGVQRLAIQLENGWRVHGVELAPRPGSGTAPVATVFVETQADATARRLVLEVENAAGERVWRSWRTLRADELGQQELAAVCFDVLPLQADPELRCRVTLAD